MKKEKLFGAVLFLFSVTGIYSIYSAQQSKEKMSDLMLANIEALASGETNWCRDSCKEWSGSTGGGIACDCGRYTEKCKSRC